MRFIIILLFIFPPKLIFAEDFTLFCEGMREFRGLKGKVFTIKEFESVLLKISNNSMEYIGVNSGRSYFFSNREYTAPKRLPHEDIKITEQYQFKPKIIKASQIITDAGDSEESSINLYSLDVNLLTGELNETEIIRNKKTNVKSMSNNFKAICIREDRSY
jgi:hypothetical protein